MFDREDNIMRVNDLAGRLGSATRPTTERGSQEIKNGSQGLRTEHPSPGQAILARRVVTLSNSQGTCPRMSLLGSCIERHKRSISYTGTGVFPINQVRPLVPQALSACKNMKHSVATLLKMSLFLAAMILGLFLPSANAITYAVKAGGGGNFATIQSCATAMAPGDTCAVFAGTYNEVVTIPAGSAGLYKTLQVNNGDTVNVFGFVVNSHTKVIGFKITNPSSPSSAACIAVAGNATDWFVTNNVMYACGDGRAMIDEPVNFAGTGHAYIQSNTMSYGCSTSSAPNVCEGMFINGDYQLIENNDMSHMSDGVTNFGVHNVFRKNNFHDTSDTDCGGNSSNCHIDFIESEPVTNGGLTRPMQYNLYEGNIIRNNSGANGHAFLTQADSCGGQCFNVIIRFNDMAHVGTYGVIDDNAGSANPGFSKVKVYNNNFIDFNQSSQNVIIGHQSNSTGAAEINNIFYWPRTSGTWNPYYVDSSSASGFTAGSNLAYCNGTCIFQNRTQSGSFIIDAPGNLVANLNFVNYSANDFHLSTGSPAISTGTFLTTASASGSSSTSLTVADASFFQDGAGITGVQADWIRIGLTNTVQISSINYSSNVITLANPVSWSSGAGIYLYKDSLGNVVLNGANPDIGALPFGSSTSSQPPAPPTNLTVTIH